jgi:hypothetical protein
MRKDDDGKRAKTIVLTEVKKVRFPAGRNSDDFSNHALGLANMLLGLIEGNAVGTEGGRRQEKRQAAEKLHRRILRLGFESGWGDPK